jgi:proteasome lid subunit RPN8/RPN11
MTTIEIAKTLWDQTWDGLKSRGAGVREAACVWAGRRENAGAATVTDVLFLEDQGDVDSGELHHCTSRQATRALFELLREKGLVIVADVHTHPGCWVNLSHTDRAHPIEYRRGLIAIVLPNFATQTPRIDSIGTHEYVGDGQWRTLTRGEVRRTLNILESP